MNRHLLEALRASVFALGATSLVLVVPASAEQSPSVTGTSVEDRDANQPADKGERRQAVNGDRAVSEALTAQPNQSMEEQQTADSEGDKISVQQKPAQVTVDKPAPQITIEQPQPEVTITTQDPKVQVEQEQPRVSVQQPEPQVSIDQAQPEVDVQDAEANVQVHQQEPQVDVRESEAQVDIQGTQNEGPQQERITREQDRQQHQQSQVGQRSDPAQADQSQGLYELSISDLRSAEVVDNQGEPIGNIVEVVAKHDGSEAGFIISTTGTEGEARHVYRSAEDFSLEGERIQLNDEAGAEALREPQGFASQEFTAVQSDQSTLGDLIRGDISAR